MTTWRPFGPSWTARLSAWWYGLEHPRRWENPTRPESVSLVGIPDRCVCAWEWDVARRCYDLLMVDSACPVHRREDPTQG